MENVPADLEPYYHQVLEWTSCGNLQCTTAKAPMDWSDPAADSIDLALVRQPATTGNRLGSLLVNPGGPGGSGRPSSRRASTTRPTSGCRAATTSSASTRGASAASSAISCCTDSRELDAYLYDILPGEIGSDEWIAALDREQPGLRCILPRAHRRPARLRRHDQRGARPRPPARGPR